MIEVQERTYIRRGWERKRERKKKEGKGKGKRKGSLFPVLLTYKLTVRLPFTAEALECLALPPEDGVHKVLLFAAPTVL